MYYESLFQSFHQNKVLMISEAIEVNSVALIRLILDAKFIDDPWHTLIKYYFILFLGVY